MVEIQQVIFINAMCCKSLMQILDIAVTEIENGHSDKYYCKDIVSLTKGDPRRHIRARVGEQCKDSREQIKCLIDLASDTSILGVMYGGWTSFI